MLLRRRFDLPETGDAALLHVNSLGYHEVWINGRKAGDACLAPALSQLDKRSLWVTYDAAPYLREGVNEVVIWLGQGWYKRGTFGRWQPDEPYTCLLYTSSPTRPRAAGTGISTYGPNATR